MNAILRILTACRLPVAAAVPALLLAPIPGAATTYLVHPDSTGAALPWVGTILEANAVAVSGDSILVSTGTYVHTDVMTLVDGVIYQGGYGPLFEGPDPSSYETTIELQPGPGLFASVIDALATGSSTLFAGFTVTGGNSSFSAGGMLCGNLTVRECRFTRNHASVVGGGLLVTSGSSALVYDCDFDRCTAGQRGGGLAAVAGAAGARFENCRVTDCFADSLGAFSNGGGGGMFLAHGIDVVRNTIRDCGTGTDGGAILMRNASGLDLLTNFMFDNQAGRNGGGLCMDGGDAMLHGQQIERCTAGQDGGAAYFGAATVTMQDSFVRECTAVGRGGGIRFDGAVSSLLRTTELTDNQAAIGGGIEISGLAFVRSYSVEIRQNTLARNGATGIDAGGGIHFEGPGFYDEIVNNIFALQTDGAAIGVVGITNQPLLLHNCVYNDALQNTDAEYAGIVDRTGTNGNIRGLPRFCDVDAVPPQLGLNIASPCAGTGYGGEGVNIGAHQGTDCTVVISVEPMTWSRIKASYR